MTALLENVLARVSRLPDDEQDAVAARLLEALTQFQRERQGPTEKPRPQFGSAREMFTLKPGFNDPIADFEG